MISTLRRLYVLVLLWRRQAQVERLDHLQREYHDMIGICCEHIERLDKMIEEAQ